MSERDCRCPKRLRAALRLDGYELVDGVWAKTGKRPIRDDRIGEHHLEIAAMRPDLWPAVARVVVKDVRESALFRALSFKKESTDG